MRGRRPVELIFLSSKPRASGVAGCRTIFLHHSCCFDCRGNIFAGLGEKPEICSFMLPGRPICSNIEIRQVGRLKACYIRIRIPYRICRMPICSSLSLENSEVQSSCTTCSGQRIRLEFQHMAERVGVSPKPEGSLYVSFKWVPKHRGIWGDVDTFSMLVHCRGKWQNSALERHCQLMETWDWQDLKPAGPQSPYIAAS